MEAKVTIVAATILAWPTTGALADISVSVGVGDVNASVSVNGADGASATGPGGASASAGTTGSTSAIGGNRSVSRSAAGSPSPARTRLALPGNLRPVGKILKWLKDDGGPAPVAPVAGVSGEVVTACRETVARAAQPYGLVQLSVVSAGQARPLSGGGQLAPLRTRVVYQRQGGYETRQAAIFCQLDASGTVSGLLDAG